MRLIRLLILGVLCATRLFAQSPLLSEAHRVVDTLASPIMQGRGYVNNGDIHAATFIKNYLSYDCGIKDVVFQRLTFSINTFPGEVYLKTDSKEQVPGKDFIVQAFSQGIKGTYDVKYVNFKKLWKQDSTKFNIKCKKYEWLCVKEDKWPKSIEKKKVQWLAEHRFFGAAGVLELTEKKLTMSASQEVLPVSWFTLKVDSNAKAPQKVKVKLDQQFVPMYESQNVIAKIPGTLVPDSFLVFTAHYDHLGILGNKVYFPGANDNASGVSMLLSLAKAIQQEPLKYTTVFIFFTGEEAGLIGSEYFVKNPTIDLKKIKFLVNIDLAGTGEDGIKVVNGAVDTLHFNLLKKLNEENNLLKSVQPRGKAANSDHYYFTQAGVPAFFIYTLGGIAAYHDIYDRAETLPLTEFEDLHRLLLLYMKTF